VKGAARTLALSAAVVVALAAAGPAAASHQGKPHKPGNIRIPATTATTVTVAWNKVTGAKRYRVLKNKKVVARTTDRRVVVKGVRCNRRPTIRVHAVDGRGRLSDAAVRVVRNATGCAAHARSRIVLTNRGFSCSGPLAQIAARNGIGGRKGRLPLLVRVNFTTYVNVSPGVIDLHDGCRGDGKSRTIDLILQVKGDGRTVGGTGNAIKVRTTARDIQITGYANCGPRSSSAHQDGAQIQGGRRIEFIDFEWGNWKTKTATCQGAAGTFVPGSVNNHPVDRVACIRCRSVSCNHGMLISESNRTLVQDSRWRSGNPADRTVSLATGVTGLCNFGSPPCLRDSLARNVTIQNNRCDRWPYGR
jgi:hypothetical protein